MFLGLSLTSWKIISVVAGAIGAIASIFGAFRRKEVKVVVTEKAVIA